MGDAWEALSVDDVIVGQIPSPFGIINDYERMF